MSLVNTLLDEFIDGSMHSLSKNLSQCCTANAVRPSIPLPSISPAGAPSVCRFHRLTLSHVNPEMLFGCQNPHL